VQQPKLGPGFLTIEISMSHISRYTHLVTLLCMSDQVVAEAITYITHNEYKRQTCVCSAGFKPMVSAIKLSQTYALCHMATGIRLSITVD